MSDHSKKITDDQFIERFQNEGPSKLSGSLGISLRSVFTRRARIESARGIRILAPPKNTSARTYESQYPARVPVSVQDGVVLIGSDAHYWPDIVTPAHRALCKLSEALKPKAVILNGDVLDGASISRHPALGWEQRPSLREELATVEERLSEIRLAAKGAELYWTIGNHDARFESRLANHAPEFSGVSGFLLKDHFPHWHFAISLWINNDVVIKHRMSGGIHATHNNALKAGKSIVTGHLHSLKIAAYTDYTGTRYGIDTGSLADPERGPQFAYSEDAPQNHRSGFVVLTFKDGRLLMPEIVRVASEDSVDFRGQLITV